MLAVGLKVAGLVSYLEAGGIWSSVSASRPLQQVRTPPSLLLHLCVAHLSKAMPSKQTDHILPDIILAGKNGD